MKAIVYVCPGSFLSWVNTNPAYSTESQTVEVTWRMNRCGIILENRCPQISIHMSSQSYEALSSPKHGVYHYQTISAYSTSDRTDVASFVYDQQKDEYYFIRSGYQTSTGLQYSLNKVCLRKEDSSESDNCEDAAIDARSYEDPTLHQTIYFNPFQ